MKKLSQFYAKKSLEQKKWAKLEIEMKKKERKK